MICIILEFVIIYVVV